MENDSDFLTRTHVNLNKDKKFFSKIIECGNSYVFFLGHVQSIFEMARRVGQIPDRARLKDHKFDFNIYASCLFFLLEQSHYN
ncbi:hypothetical protein LEP1GSC070_3438 [Leptospira santarosai str. AIM]|nr:hypothetical protein LEP1GSC070_3438 [Leptospira santarosai str. AIM]